MRVGAVTQHEEVRRAHGFHPLEVKRIAQETEDTKSYVLEVPAELRETFRYEPGQFCTFKVRFGEDEQLRSYSMSSDPAAEPDPVVTVKRVPGGRVSNWFHDNVSPGDILEVTRPAGVFCERSGDSPVVAFCGGSGITPVMSITKSVLRKTRRAVSLLYANRDPNSVIFEDALRDLGRRHSGRFEVRHHFDTDGGYLTPEDISLFVGRFREADFYICGPGPFMEIVESALVTLGVDRGRILIERFETGDAATQTGPGNGTRSEQGNGTRSEQGNGTRSEPDDGTRSKQGNGTRSEPDDGTRSEPDLQVPDAVTIVLKGSPTTVSYRKGDTVLEAARRAGLQPPFSCEAGNCATCMAVLREGSATMRANNALTVEEVEEGWILTCQALPRGVAVKVEYESF
ncbi:MAG TPA: ferredoxin--NADP reductase [Acidimicrobiales bacterium]|nr:ferredoxin--NADP reductase [Acidimicrobiales bacterium]